MLRIRSSMAARVQRSRHSRMGRTGDGWPRRTGPHGANMVSRHSPAAAPAMENARATPSPRFSPSSSTPARAALAQDDDTRAALERMATEGDKVIPHKSTVDITRAPLSKIAMAVYVFEAQKMQGVQISVGSEEYEASLACQ